MFNFSDRPKLSKCFIRYFNKSEADELLSKSTIVKYKEVASLLVVMLNDMDARKIDGNTITNLKQQLNIKNLSASRRNHFLIVLGNLLKYLAEEK